MKVIYGKFENNKLTDYDTGEELYCITYNSVFESINNKIGFFHIKYDKWNNPIIFQYILND